jgi:hypothetical protein
MYSRFFGQSDWQMTVAKNFESASINFFKVKVNSYYLLLARETVNTVDGSNFQVCRFGSIYASDYLDFTGMERFSETDFRLLFEQIRNLGIDVIWFSNISQETSFYKVLSKLDTNENEIHFLPCISTVGIRCFSSYPAYVSSRSKNTRRNFRRAAKTITELNAKFNFAPATIEDLTWLLEFQSIRANSVGMNSLLSNKSLSKTIYSLIEIDNVFIAKLSVENETVSSLLILADTRVISIYIQAFNPKWQAYSPSFCLIAKLVEYAHVHKFEYVDFLRGREEYKLHFINNEVSMIKFIKVINSSLNTSSILKHINAYEE